MPAFASRLTMRRIVWLTLLAWTMALLAGMANACLLQPHGSRAPTLAASPQEDSAEQARHAAMARHADPGHHEGQAARDDHSPDAGKAGCLKFCDDQSSTVVTGNAAQPDLPDPALFAHVQWSTLAPRDAIVQWWPAQRPRSPGPPVVIRFLRLTI
jgi:hypothetical protein